MLNLCKGSDPDGENYHTKGDIVYIMETNHILIVEDDKGTRETVFSGEVSVRGLYGYV